MSDDWLSLSEAARLLGVHPSTVRSWANQGTLPMHRTQGGHRRFRRSDVELWLQSRQASGLPESSSITQNALRRTRLEVAEGRLQAEAWYQKLDDDARDQYRRSGRLLLQSVSQVSDEADARAEARSIGYEYAALGHRYGMSCIEATHAFLFFRNVLLEAMLSAYESASVRSPHAWGNMLRKIHAFTDQILVTLLETYEAYPRASR